MTEKAKPRLHLIKTSDDPSLFNADLDWFFNCYPSECGLQSVGVANILDAALIIGSWKTTDEHAHPLTVRVTSKSPGHEDQDPWNDHHVRLGSDTSGVFSRGRRIWRRVKQLPWHMQEALRLYYEPRQLWSGDEGIWANGAFGPAHIEREAPIEWMIRAAHEAYYLSQRSAA